MALRISPEPNCKYCHGTGEITDWVPYGDTDAAMTTTCDCVLEQVPEGHEDEYIIIDPVRLMVRSAPEFEYDE